MSIPSASKAAAVLGRLARGIPKTISEEDRRRRAERMRAASLDYHARIAAGLAAKARRGKDRKPRKRRGESSL